MPSKVSKPSAAEDAIAKYREVSAANLSVLAKGNVSRLQKYLGSQQQHPKNFAWLADNAPVVAPLAGECNDENSNPQTSNEPRNSEYKENYISWPLPDATAAVPQPSKWSPNSLFPTDIDASKWTSEHKTMFADIGKDGIELGEVAGIKTKTAVKAPTFFAWKKSQVKDTTTATTTATADVDVNSVTIEDNTSPVEQETIEAVSEPTKKVEESPMATYEDAIDPSKWKSEYNTNYKTQEEEVEKLTAGVATRSEIGHPSNFAWDATTIDQPLPPLPPTDHILKHVSFDTNPISEYSENFQKRTSAPVEKSYSIGEATAPIPSYSDHVDTSKWKSEYSSNFSSSKNSTIAAPEPVAEDEIKVDEIIAQQFEAVDAVSSEVDAAGETIIDDNYTAVDSSEVPQYVDTACSAQSEVIEQTPRTASYASSGRSNMENVLYFPKTEIEVASQTAAEPAKSRRLWFTSEQKDQYQWPTAATLPQKSKSSPITSKENIFAICQSLDGSDLVKSKSSLTIGPKMTTETRSMYAWPDPAMVIKRDIIKAPKSQMALGDDPKPVTDTTTTTSTTISVDSITPVTSHTQDVIIPAPSVPIVSRQREFVEEKAAPSEISTFSGPLRKTTSLQLQDSAAAMRIARDTGLRLDEQRVIHRPHSAPIRRTSSLVADQIIAQQQSKKGSVDAFNPILMHKRFPMSSDKQIGRWRTETKSSFVWSKKKTI